jgi:uncharacterized membrane protein
MASTSPSRPSNASQASSGSPSLDLQSPLVSLAAGGILLLTGLRRDSALGAIATLTGGGLIYRGLKGEQAVPGAVTKLVNTATSTASDQTGVSDNEPQVERSITINRPMEEVFTFWSQPENFAAAMAPLVTISQTGLDTSHWSIEGPAGTSFGWDARTTIDQAAQTIGWESLPGADIPNDGEVSFTKAPGDRGTEAHLRMRFDPPGGKLGEIVANHVDIGPKMIAMASLRRIKSLIETGEVPTLERNPSARGTGDLV